MSNIIECDDTIAFHVGSYIDEFIEDSGNTRKSFAELLGMSVEDINALVEGNADLSDSEATKLSHVTGVSKQSWLNLQASYHKNKALIDSKQTTKENKDYE